MGPENDDVQEREQYAEVAQPSKSDARSGEETTDAEHAPSSSVRGASKFAVSWQPKCKTPMHRSALPSMRRRTRKWTKTKYRSKGINHQVKHKDDEPGRIPVQFEAL